MPQANAVFSGPSAALRSAKLGHEGRFSVDTRDLPSAIRFDVWRAFWEPALHVTVPRTSAEGFCGQAELRRLGRHVLLKFQADAADYRRSRSQGLRDGLGHWLVALRLGEADGQPRELLLGSLSQGFGLRHFAGRCCGVLMQPAHSPQLAPLFVSARSLPLSSPGARILAGMLPSMTTSADEISVEEAPRLEIALSSLLDACLMGLETLNVSIRKQLEAARRARVIALVDAALDEADLSPSMLVERSGISRSELYRCFAPIGGIARIIQQRRLSQAYRDLMRADGPVSVSRIGEAVGFYDHSSFTRAFRREFGLTPSEVLARRPLRSAEALANFADALGAWQTRPA